MIPRSSESDVTIGVGVDGSRSKSGILSWSKLALALCLLLNRVGFYLVL
jgi:hypothetical protein